MSDETSHLSRARMRRPAGQITLQGEAAISIGTPISGELNPATVWDHPKNWGYGQRNREIIGGGV
jgi:hypothetical protein